MENSKETNETNNLDAVAGDLLALLIFSALAAKSKAKQTEKAPEPEEKADPFETNKRLVETLKKRDDEIVALKNEIVGLKSRGEALEKENKKLQSLIGDIKDKLTPAVGLVVSLNRQGLTR